MKIIISLAVAALLLLSAFFIFTQNKTLPNTPIPNNAKEIAEKGTEMKFISSGLHTNTSINSIPFDEILSGGPPKDGIPAINDPQFISIAEASEIEQDDQEGLAVVIGSDARFYPYTILVWHEIVNDIIGDTPVSVTFCPLCGTGIVFDRRIDDEVVDFGVSGKLWQSNLLMYDNLTESLWSQAIGEAVVGEKTGTTLEIIDSQLISFAQFKKSYPDGLVLSRKTGHSRNYGVYPYGDYEENENLIFPVSVNDNRFFAKELLYVVPLEEVSAAFVRNDLFESGKARINAGEKILNAIIENGSIIVTDENGSVLSGYTEMWFSWATHHQDDGIVWSQ